MRFKVVILLLEFLLFFICFIVRLGLTCKNYAESVLSFRVTPCRLQNLVKTNQKMS